MNSSRIVNQVFFSRKNRHSHPDGTFDKGGRWYPSFWEECECCSGIRNPSRHFPYSYLHHCRTKKHITNLVQKHGVNDRLLLREAAEMPAEEEKAKRACSDGIAYKKFAIGEDGRLCSIYDGSSWVLNKERKEVPMREHLGGFYVYEDMENAIDAPYPPDSIMGGEHYPKVVVQCNVGGRYCRYGKKLAFERVVPRKVLVFVS